MTQRPRSHQLEDESRRAFANLLPAAWTVQDLVPDYGLDQRVEVFANGRATGLVFYVQLKATDNADNSRNRQISIRPDHYAYWTSLNDPVLLVLYFAASQSAYARWAHRFHPEYHPATMLRGKQTVRFSKSSRWHSSDADWVVQELKNLREVAHGAVHLPITVGVSDAPDTPPKAVSLQMILNDLRSSTSRNDVRWTIGDDRSDMFHVYVGSKRVMARAGKVIYSITNVSREDKAFPRAKAAVICLALAVGLAGSDSAGIELIARYCASPPIFLPTAMGHHVLLLTMRSRQFTLALNLIESWLDVGAQDTYEAAFLLHGGLKVLGTGALSAPERQRLDRITTSRPMLVLDDVAARGLQINLVEEYGTRGQTKEAFQLFDSVFSESEHPRDIPSDVTMHAAQWALALGEYDSADTWLESIVDERHLMDAALLQVRSLLLQGRYLEGILKLCTATDPNDRRGPVVLTGFLLLMITVLLGRGTQERQPHAALGIVRSLESEASSEDIWKAFIAALEYDAAGLSTWSLCQVLNAKMIADGYQKKFSRGLPGPPAATQFLAGPHGCLGAAILDELDGERWAFACCTLMRALYLRGVMYAVDYALRVCRDSFLDALQNGLPNQADAEFILTLAKIADEARAREVWLDWREAPEHLDSVKGGEPRIKYAYALVATDDDHRNNPIVFGLSHQLEDEAVYRKFRELGSDILAAMSTEDAGLGN